MLLHVINFVLGISAWINNLIIYKLILLTAIDHCASSPCDNFGTCTTTNTGYTCTCSTGYIGPRCQTGKTLFPSWSRPSTIIIYFKSNFSSQARIHRIFFFFVGGGGGGGGGGGVGESNLFTWILDIFISRFARSFILFTCLLPEILDTPLVHLILSRCFVQNGKNENDWLNISFYKNSDFPVVYQYTYISVQSLTSVLPVHVRMVRHV